ncbi:hypothetical protein Cni_G15624 [Canna indica]|uniref:PWWP domain-containing protein n=1 Tax=Canna indica TaxID=4628 RepID=A0AAQ3KGF6_9LILI|nr:hypothetical protein Cni_G15624 [Canna indica]
MFHLDAPTTPMEESGEEKDETQGMVVEVTGGESGNEGPIPAVDSSMAPSLEVGADEGVKEEKGVVDVINAGEVKVMVEVGTEDAENDLDGGKVSDRDDIFTPEIGVLGGAHAGGVGNQNVQVPEQEPLERRKRGRPRRSTAVEDSLHARYSHPFQDEKDGFDQGRIFTPEFGALGGSHADGVGNQNVQVQEQEPPERKKRGRPRRSTAVEDRLYARYSHLFQDETKDGFAVGDLVWGKVRSHPWWPGQIFDAADASEMALLAQREGHYLVVYFGDKTFAWCPDSHLKRFQRNFAQLEKQGSTDVFGTAVNGALVEVSRVIELGMACGCSIDEASAVLENQKVENAGVREGACSPPVDKSWIMNSFEPKKFIHYVRMLALFPCQGADILDIAIAKSHSKAFHRTTGHPSLSLSVLVDQGLGYDGESSPTIKRNFGNAVVELLSPIYPDPSSVEEKINDRSGSSRKKKHVLEDGRKKKSLSELMGEEISPSNIDVCGRRLGSRDSLRLSVKRQKISSSSVVSGKGKMKRLDSLGDLPTPSLNCNKQLIAKENDQVVETRTRSPNMTKKRSLGLNPNRSADLDGPDLQLGTERIKGCPLKDCSSYEIISQLRLAATGPFNTQSSLDATVSFFTQFNHWVASNYSDINGRKVGRRRSRRQLSNFKTVSLDLAKPDYIQDSYWSDIIVCSTFEETIGFEDLKGNVESPGTRQKKRKRNESKMQAEDFLTSGQISKDEEYLQIGSACAVIADKLQPGSPLDNREEDATSGQISKDEEYLQIGSACAGIADKLQPGSPLDNREDDALCSQ